MGCSEWSVSIFYGFEQVYKVSKDSIKVLKLQIFFFYETHKGLCYKLRKSSAISLNARTTFGVADKVYVSLESYIL